MNLKSAGSRGVYAGLFGYSSGTLSNLGLTGEHMLVSGTATHANGFARVGGLLGHIAANGTIKDCYSTGSVRAFSMSGGSAARAGGLVGSSTDAFNSENCYATGDVSASAGSGFSYAGGFLGWGEGSFTDCYATGNVFASASGVGGSSYAGGLLGHITGNSTIDNCYALGDVSTGSYVGGLVGATSSGTGDTILIRNCYATGHVSGVLYAGGLMGDSQQHQSGGDPYHQKLLRHGERICHCSHRKHRWPSCGWPDRAGIWGLVTV